jgi:hypothetical protein
MKIRPAGTELFYAVGQTDRHDQDNSHFTILQTRLQINYLNLPLIAGLTNMRSSRKLFEALSRILLVMQFNRHKISDLQNIIWQLYKLKNV